MVAVEIVCDGWTRRHIGDVLLRRNPDHIQRVLDAIRRRHDNEVELRYSAAMSDVLK